MVQVSLSLLLCLVGAVLSTPPETEADGASILTELSLFQQTEAIPSDDFTVYNVSGTFEAILKELELTDPNSREKRRPCACSTTIGAYGGREGTAFVDVSTNPCDVQMTNVWVRHGGIVDAIQVKYRFPNGDYLTQPLRGGTGGGLTHINVPTGAKIIGLFGGINNRANYGPVISQLRILVLNAEERLQIYGPFGRSSVSGTFAVYGDIKSIFGYHRQYLDGLGAFYEPWGVCGSPCASRNQGSGLYP